MIYTGLAISSIRPRGELIEVLMVYRSQSGTFFSKVWFEKKDLPQFLADLAPHYHGKDGRGRDEWRFGTIKTFEARHLAGQIKLNFRGRYFDLVSIDEKAQFGY